MVNDDTEILGLYVDFVFVIIINTSFVCIPNVAHLPILCFVHQKIYDKGLRITLAISLQLCYMVSKSKGNIFGFKV